MRSMTRCARLAQSPSRACRSRRGGYCRHWGGSVNQRRLDWIAAAITRAQQEEMQMNIKVGRQAIAEATEKLKNWGRWGKDDQIGTLNHVRPDDIVKAARLISRGTVRALGIPRHTKTPQPCVSGGRFNPIHQM